MLNYPERFGSAFGRMIPERILRFRIRFTDLLINLEGRNDLIGGGFYGWAMSFNEMTPKGFLTKCAHPSINGHKVIANELYNHIKLKYLTNE